MHNLVMLANITNILVVIILVRVCSLPVPIIGKSLAPNKGTVVQESNSSPDILYIASLIVLSFSP